MAVLFADVSDSTRMYESLGDTAAFRQVRVCIDLLTSITTEFDGRIVKTIGDGLMCAFPGSDQAAQAAREMHRRIAEHPPLPRGKRLTIRIGFHYGPVIESGTDVFGDSVNVAARMAGLALAGQVLTTVDAVTTMSPTLRETTRRLEALPVKGKEEAIEVYEVLWQASSDRTVVPGRTGHGAADTANPALALTYRGRQFVLEAAATLGRDGDNTVSIADPLASRRHARVELRGGKFVLIDQSSNGTFVTPSGGEEIKLRREEMILQGSGVIAFGHSAREPGSELLEYRCKRPADED